MCCVEGGVLGNVVVAAWFSVNALCFFLVSPSLSLLLAGFRLSRSEQSLSKFPYFFSTCHTGMRSRDRYNGRISATPTKLFVSSSRRASPGPREQLLYRALLKFEQILKTLLAEKTISGHSLDGQNPVTAVFTSKLKALTKAISLFPVFFFAVFGFSTRGHHASRAHAALCRSTMKR